MPKREPHKKQHTVPKTYLENFVDNNGSLWMLNPSFKIYKNAPKNTLTQKFYYNVQFQGKDSLIIEKGFLGSLESEFAEIYRQKISQRIRLDDDEKAKLALFIAAQLNRVPGRRDAMRDFIDQIEETVKPFMNMPDDMKKKLASHSAPLIPGHEENSMPVEELFKMRDDLNASHSAMLPKLSLDIAPIIFSMQWGFMVYEKEDNVFITSDDPCVMVNPDLEAHYGYEHMYSSPGLAQNGVELMIPISPNIAILCGWKLKSDRAYIPVTSKMVDNANKRQIRHSALLITNSERHANSLKSHILKRRQLYDVRNVLANPLEQIHTPIID